MALHAVISDVHGNLAALEAVLADAEHAGATEVWCLGDVVDYGPKPGECVDLVRASCAFTIRGNHDLAVTGQTSLAAFNPFAASCAIWSSGQLNENQHAWLSGLPDEHLAGRVGCWHGSPRDPVWEYVSDPFQAALILEGVPQELVLVGHTHVPRAYQVPLRGAGAPRADQAELAATHPDTPVELAGRRWIVNPGSVGFPRMATTMSAQWGLLDTDAWTFTFKRSDYDREATRDALIAAGDPVARMAATI